MDKVLRPERFDVIPSAQDAAKRWLHWLMTLENFVAAIPSAPDKEVNKLHLLINYVTSDVYQLFCEAETYEEAIALLKTLYIKTPNEIFARIRLGFQPLGSRHSPHLTAGQMVFPIVMINQSYSSNKT